MKKNVKFVLVWFISVFILSFTVPFFNGMEVAVKGYNEDMSEDWIKEIIPVYESEAYKSAFIACIGMICLLTFVAYIGGEDEQRKENTKRFGK